MTIYSLFKQIASWFKLRKKQVPTEPVEPNEFSNREATLPQYGYDFVEDFPVDIREKCVYIIGKQPYHWAMVFICPCGCKRHVTLNTLEDTFPSWSYFIHKNSITIKPSIHRLSGCKSHFFIRKGEVVWSVED